MRGVDTTAVHGGARRDPTHRGVGDPIVLSCTFDYPEHDEGQRAPYIYTRYANPTIEACERRLAALHGGGQARLFASGMAAIAAALRAVVKSGDRVLTTPELYGGTRTLFDVEFPEIGITVDTLDRPTLDAIQADPSLLADHVGPTHRVLYLESPTNPLVRVLDVPQLAKAAHDVGLFCIVDHTFAGPVLSRPLDQGVDLVVESTTKSLGGHSDLIGGSVVGRDAALMAHVDRLRRHWGPIMDPAAAWRLLRSLPTVPLRVRRAGEGAATLADALAARDWVTAVHHPSRFDHPDHDIASRTLDGPVGMVTFVVRGGDEAAVALRRHVRLIRPAPSLGGVESLLSLPFETSHAAINDAARRAVGIAPGTVRLPVGLEDPEDLLADLDQAAVAAGLTTTSDPRGTSHKTQAF